MVYELRQCSRADGSAHDDRDDDLALRAQTAADRSAHRRVEAIEGMPLLVGEPRGS